MNKRSLTGVSFGLLLLGCSGKLDVGGKGSGGSMASNGGSFGEGGSITPQGGSSGHTSEGGFPGTLGSRCVEGGVALEAQETVAEAQVRTLNRCYFGYACSIENECIPNQACTGPGGGECVIYTSLASDEVGRNWTVDDGSSSAGFAKLKPPITGISANETGVYFIGYGSRDKLGNFNNDGTLRGWSLEQGTMTTLATDLMGPVRLAVTSSYAYVLVDGAPLIDSELRPRLLRIPLSGGKAEPLQEFAGDLSQVGGFVTRGPRAFWAGDSQIYTMSDLDTEPSQLAPSSVLADVGWPAAADENFLYYASRDLEGQPPMIRRTAINGGPAEDVTSPVRAIAVRGDWMYGVEDVENSLLHEKGLVLVRAPTTGGDWVRVRALGGSSDVADFQMVGMRYFVASSIPGGGSYKPLVLTGSLDSDALPVRILQGMVQVFMPWVGTADAVFWTDGNSIYRRALE